MTISIYKDDESNRVDHIISLNSDGEQSFTYYYYDSVDTERIIFTATSKNESDVNNITETDPEAITLLAEMNISVYDEVGKKVLYALALNEDEEKVYTYYYYTDLGVMNFTASSTNQDVVSNLTGQDPDQVELTWEDMSIAVYGKEDGETDVSMLYTYTLNSQGEKIKSTYEYFIIDGERTDLTERVVQENMVTGEISYLNYEIYINENGIEKTRVDYATSFNDEGEETYTFYYYQAADSENIAFTATSIDMAKVNALEGLDIINTMTLIKLIILSHSMIVVK